MRKNIIAFAVGFAGAWLVYEALTRNPLWFTKFAPVPESVPEWMVREVRERGGM